MTTTIAVINKSTLVSDADVALMASACDYQLVKHVAPLSNRGIWHVKPFTKNQTVPASYIPIVIMDDPDQANTLGYHTEDAKGKVWGRVFVKPVLHYGGTVLKGALSVSSVLSHEVCETFCDKSVNMWIDRLDGTFVALEVADPVENDAYEIPVTDHLGNIAQVSVSNFILYSWFDAFAPAGSRFDYMNNVKAPLTMSPGGYIVILNTKTGKVTEVFGSHEAEKLHKQKKPHCEGSRTFVRLARHGHGHHDEK